jgi:hypothetical protein
LRGQRPQPITRQRGKDSVDADAVWPARPGAEQCFRCSRLAIAGHGAHRGQDGGKRAGGDVGPGWCGWSPGIGGDRGRNAFARNREWRQRGVQGRNALARL